MTYFWVDDRLWGHPKWLGTPASARALWVTAGSWCAANLTDGFVPKHVLALLGGRARDAQALVDAGLWVAVQPELRQNSARTQPRASQNSARTQPELSQTITTRFTVSGRPVGGWEFKNWQEWQKSREEVEEKRAQARDRMQRLRAGRRSPDGSREQNANVHANFAGSSRDVRDPVPSLPVPTQPNPLVGEVVRRLSRGRTTTTTDDEIAQWQVWAGPGVDLEPELRSWLLHNGTVDLDNPRAALKGWLEHARDRAGANTTPGRTPTAGTPVPSRPQCTRHPGRPIPPGCPDCAREKAPAPDWRALRDAQHDDDDGPEF